MRVLSASSTRPDILPSAIDSMVHEVVLLDQHGRIVMVNEAFLRFGRENGYATVAGCLGMDYLDICLEAGMAGDRTAAKIGYAIQDVLTGRRERFATLYPCHSPWQKRWFRLHVSPWGRDGVHGAVLVHEDVTPERHAELALLAAHSPWDPQAETQQTISVQGYLDALAQRIEAILDRPVIVDGATDLHIIVPPATWLEALARTLLWSDRSRDEPLILRADGRERTVHLTVHGLTLVPDEQLDALRAVPVSTHVGRRLGGQYVLRLAMRRAQEPHVA